ncbi:alpha-2-macroglobulin family protein [Maritimibacter fusiformis]|uniref:Alpha-2-macroglobulin family protein n=1 Tax=Maritimibacter fusiformis TaxID=2603819 RepID=A0A5D0RJZ8_9RHOB|nr:alpha-2-macroglobulin family protein [Maritimibacter fusiformis]TYB81957.1 alpha-2-macroglobulin family protein [Maritimibacter fusiformis]
MRTFFVFIAFCLGFTSMALAENPVSDKRVILFRDMDFPGGDLQSIFDTTLQACENACFANDDCGAYTYNTRSNACFLKQRRGAQEPYAGAFSAEVVPVPSSVLAGAQARAEDLDFLYASDLSAATRAARRLPHDFVSGGFDPVDLVNYARQAEAEANIVSAMRYMAAATVITDAAGDWIEYARLSNAAAQNSENSSDKNKLFRQALDAAINGYLRSSIAPQQANALIEMATALEAIGRGRDTIPALRLAQAADPRNDTDAALDRAIGMFGFRVTDSTVDSDAASPRICATFSEALAPTGVDYAPFVQSDITGLAVEASGQQLCVEGLTHGERYALTLRAGLPSESGEMLVKPVQLNLYVRDRTASVHFPGRAYVLPATPDAGLPIVGVNVTEIDLTLARLSDRNLVQTFHENYFGRSLDSYEADYFTEALAEPIWTGTAEIATELNVDVTTRLPIGEAIGDQPPGIYVLQASVPGVDQWDSPPATQWFVISDIGVTTMLGADGLHVFARALGSAEPMAGARVELVSSTNAVLGEVQTDPNGYAHFIAGQTAGRGAAAPALVVVRTGDDIAFLSLTEPEFDLSDRGVEGRPAAPPIDLFVTTDRGAYRAGEVVNATALARDGTAEAIEGLPVTAVMFRPDGVEYSRHLSSGVGAGGHVFNLPVAGNAPRGTWRLDLHADPDAPALASTTFLVEDFLPERIDFTLALPEDRPLTLADRPNLTLDARYLFGAPGADLEIEGEIRLSQATEVDGWAGYRFGRHDARMQTQWGGIADSRTDDEGRAVLPISFPSADVAGVPLTANIAIRVKEGSGRPVERTLARDIMPDGPMIGIRPGFDGALSEGSEATFRLIALGTDLNPTAMNVTWELNRIVTDYQWYRSSGSWYWEPTTSRTRIASGEATLGGTPVEVAAPVDWGQYELVVSRADGAYLASSVDFYAGWYGGADAATTPDMLEVSLDAEAYAPGDTATLRFVPRSAGKTLITVVSNRLIDMVAVDATEGENTVTLPVTDAWGAGAYVTATLIRPLDDATGRAPTRALGLTHASVDPGDHQLTASLTAPAEAQPRGPLEITVNVDGVVDGDTAWVTVAAVDVGILNLTSFASPDPSSHYFGQRRLGMGIRDLYGRLIDGRTGEMGAIRSGGDAMAQMRMDAPPPTEELMAQFSGPVEVIDGKARVTFALPEFNGTVRLMAVAWSNTGVGQAEADVLVRDPVVVTASLPRFLAPGDEARMLLEITHAKGPAGEMELSAISDGVVIAGGSLLRKVALEQLGTARLSVPIRVNAEGIFTIDLALVTPDGTRLTKTLNLPVESLDPEVARTSRMSLAPGNSLTLGRDIFDGLRPGSARATLTAGPLARIDAAGLLDQLDRYPYGCTEQQTSRALPLLYMGGIAEAMGLSDRADLPDRIQKAVTAVLANQSSGGSFGLWRPDSGDLWLDAYVSDFLGRARTQGYDVPDTAFRAAMDNLRNRVNYYPEFDEGGGDLAYALYVLAREGAAAMGDLRYYADIKAGAFTTPLALAQLGAALASYGDSSRADAMFARASSQLQGTSDEGQVWRDDYGTNLRDAAAVLTLAVEAGSDALDREALLARVARGDKWLSTQEATWSLLAANALLTDSTAQGLTLDGSAMTGPLVEVMSPAQLAVPRVIANDGTRATDLTVTTFGVPLVPEPAGGNGFGIERRYFTMEGEPADIAEVEQGTRLVTLITVTPWGRSDGRLIVSDPLPAGFEIDNPNLIRGGDIAALEWLQLTNDTETTEFRQDRFIAAVNWSSDKAFRLAYIVRAVTPGTFHHPAPLVEDMYRPTYRATGEAGSVIVRE